MEQESGFPRHGSLNIFIFPPCAFLKINGSGKTRIIYLAFWGVLKSLQFISHIESNAFSMKRAQIEMLKCFKHRASQENTSRKGLTITVA